MLTPKTSIIITTHARPHLLARAVESARASGTNLEIVVVDDASTDETAQVCASLIEINYVRAERNQGVAGARQIGLLASSGEFISFLDDDDLRLVGSLDAQAEALQAMPEAGLIYGQALLGDQRCVPGGRLYPHSCPQGDIFWKLLAQNFIPCGSVVFRRSCLYRIGLSDEALPGLDDWDLWIRIAELYPVIAFEQPVMIWRQSAPGSRQGTSRADQLVALSTQQFQQRWMKLPRTAHASQTERRQVWRSFSQNMASHLIWETARAMKSRLFRQAIKNISTLLRRHAVSAARVLFKHTTARFLRTKAQDVWRAKFAPISDGKVAVRQERKMGVGRNQS